MYPTHISSHMTHIIHIFNKSIYTQHPWLYILILFKSYHSVTFLFHATCILKPDIPSHLLVTPLTPPDPSHEFREILPFNPHCHCSIHSTALDNYPGPPYSAVIHVTPHAILKLLVLHVLSTQPNHIPLSPSYILIQLF